MKVVFDTNVSISAFVFPRGIASRALERVIDGQDELVVSRPIIEETVGILGRKFGRDDEALARTALLLTDLADVVAPEATTDT